MKLVKLLLLGSLLLIISCTRPNPNTNQSGEDELKSLEIHRTLSKSDKNFRSVEYVPIYSDIYLNKNDQSSLLSATLSIRNTSLTDSLFVSTIDYYNTEGDLVRPYIDQPIVLSPMSTVNYVVEKEDTSGGPGANFIVEFYSESKTIKPLIQAIMIGITGNKAFAFSTDSYSIE